MKRCPFCAEEIQDAAVVCRFCGRELGRLPATGEAAGSAFVRVLRGGEVALGVCVVGIVAYLTFAQLGFLTPDVLRSGIALDSLANASNGRAPFTLSLLDSELLDIRAGEHFDTTFVVDAQPCRFTGSLRGVAGGDRDFVAYLLDERGYERWHSGEEAQPLYESGRSASVSLDVSLPRPGRYALVVSNTFSVFTDKTLLVDEARVVCD